MRTELRGLVFGIRLLSRVTRIEQCRTAALGGHVLRCDDCGTDQLAYNSCGNRHCPKCQSNAAKRWLEARQADLLPVEYCHVVFTLPAPIADIACQNALTVKVSCRPLSQRGRSGRVFTFLPFGLLLHLGQAVLGFELVGRHHHGLGLRSLGLGQALQDVAQLVGAATLDPSASCSTVISSGRCRRTAGTA